MIKRYFYLINLYASKPGTASEKDFEEWSIRSSDSEKFAQSNPVKFKTLNLTKIMRYNTWTLHRLHFL